MNYELFGLNRQEIECKISSFTETLQVNEQDIKRIMEIPQRTPEWLKMRSCRLTASNYGSAVGHHSKNPPEKLIENMLWGTFKGNEATKWGNDNEPVAALIYENFMRKMVEDSKGKYKQVTFQYPGLIICKKYPWLAVSPDGLVCVDGKWHLLEIKCPFGYKRNGLYKHIPHYYYDQIQGIMGILNLPFCDFIVWSPDKTHIRRYPFDASYWKQVMFPKLQQFYMEQFLPRYILKQENLLKPGCIDPDLFVSDDNDNNINNINNYNNGDEVMNNSRSVDFLL